MIYADYAATTPLDSEVFEKMKEVFEKDFANPSSVHQAGRNASKIIEEARAIIAKEINCNKNEIYFTSGGTESDNWALSGFVNANNVKHIITSSIEHHAVLNTCKELEKQGIKVTYLPVDSFGRIIVSQLENAITEETGLISIMTANNEIGTIQDIDKIGEIATEHNIPFHTDAVQAMGNIKIDVEKSKISMLSASAHKFYGPKGIGFLYIKNGLKIKNIFEGGAQERDRRPGTLNTPLIVGLAYALEKAINNIEENNRLQKGRIETVKKIVFENLDGVEINGDENKRLSGNLSLNFKGIQSEGLLVLLDMMGVCVSAGAACSAGAVKVSHVLQAIKKTNGATIRISLSHLTSQEDAEKIGKSIVDAVINLRKKNC